MGCAASTEADLPVLADDGTLHPLITRMQKLEPESVVVFAGAGISVNAGIPDFRSPGTGLYTNLDKFNLPYPEAVFDLDFFRSDPKPFSILAKELWPTNFQPTVTHMFIRLLHDKGMLLRHYTQNVDGLDRASGIPDERLIEAHGSFGAGHCIDCRAVYSEKDIRETLFNGEVVTCGNCAGLVKPDIVFFGEQLPQKFHQHGAADMQKAKTIIVMGTSLKVNPVAGLVKGTRGKDIDRVLVNRDVPAGFGARGGERELIMKGDCDAQVWEIARALGWMDDLKRLINKECGDISGPDDATACPDAEDNLEPGSARLTITTSSDNLSAQNKMNHLDQLDYGSSWAKI
jgi:NAD-dependent SIR2 family protein deacetylase